MLSEISALPNLRMYMSGGAKALGVFNVMQAIAREQAVLCGRRGDNFSRGVHMCPAGHLYWVYAQIDGEHLMFVTGKNKRSDCVSKTVQAD